MYKKYDKVPDEWKDSGTNLVYFGDFHHRKMAPNSRTDDFDKTEFEKVRQIRVIANEYHAKALLQPGDFLDKPKFDETFLNKVMTAWGYPQVRQARTDLDAGVITKDEFIKRTLDYVPMVALAGNHELYGGSLKTYPRTSLAFLEKAGFMNIVDQDHPYLIKTKDGTIAISGSNYDLDLLNDNPDINRYMPKQRFGDANIFMVHEALFDTQLLPQMHWLPLNKIWDKTTADLTLAGHIHTGFGFIKHDGKLFGNPGAIAQQSTSGLDLNRDVTVTIIHVDDQNQIDVRELPLDLPDPHTIFDLDAKNDKLENEKYVESIHELMTTVDDVDDIDATAIIDKVAQTNKISKNIRELAINKTQEAISELDAGDQQLDPNIDYSIKSIKLENFESHTNTVLNLPLNKKPTVLIGESSQGKSSVLRALYWVLENAGDGKQFVRRYPGIDSADVTLTRADGTSVTRHIKISRGKKRISVKENGYHIVYPNGEEHDTNTEGLSEVQRIFGLTYLKLDEKTQIPINFMKQEDPWYFIGEKPAQRAKIIGALYGTQYIMAGAKSLEADRRKLTMRRKMIKDDIAEGEVQLEPLKNAELNLAKANEITKLFETYKIRHERLDRVREATQTYNSALEKEQKYADLVKALEAPVAEVKADMAELKNGITQASSLKKVIETLNSAQTQLESTKKMAKLDVSEVKDKIAKSKKAHESLVEVKQAYTDFKTAQKQIVAVQALIDAEPKTVEIKHQMAGLKTNLDKVKIGKSQYEQIVAETKKADTLKTELADLTTEYKKLNAKLIKESTISVNLVVNYKNSGWEPISQVLMPKSIQFEMPGKFIDDLTNIF